VGCPGDRPADQAEAEECETHRRSGAATPRAEASLDQASLDGADRGTGVRRRILAADELAPLDDPALEAHLDATARAAALVDEERRER
jgi:hypothetical protein